MKKSQKLLKNKKNQATTLFLIENLKELFATQTLCGFEGVGHEKDEVGRKVGDELVILDSKFLTGKIKPKPHPFVEYFKFLKQFEDENTVAKYKIPSPVQTFQQMFREEIMKILEKFIKLMRGL